ncbi:MAG: hypothetical protein ACYDAN_07950 [Candidatus Limnocylindrales bacterium]
MTADEHDNASTLSREGVFRLNVGVGGETFGLTAEPRLEEPCARLARQQGLGRSGAPLGLASGASRPVEPPPGEGWRGPGPTRGRSSVGNAGTCRSCLGPRSYRLPTAPGRARRQEPHGRARDGQAPARTGRRS